MPYVDRSISRPGTTRRFRLAGHDYRSNGLYFVTFCTYKRHELLGTIKNDEIELSPAGIMVSDVVSQMEANFNSCKLDCSVVMPNHLHLLIGLGTDPEQDESASSVSEIVRWLKNSTVRRYGSGVRSKNWPPYDGKLWQEGFHDHIVRNEKELETIRDYVTNNVYMWDKDKFYGPG